MTTAIDKARKRAAQQGEVQRRVFAVAPEVRMAADGEPIGVKGHAAVFDQPSEVLYDWWEGQYIEEMAPGSFTKTLQEADVRFLINHDPNLILARNTAGTLRLAEDAIGLAVDADLEPTTYGLDLLMNMRRGNVTQMSFMFQVMKDDWTGTRDGLPRRYVQEVRLYDVSAVTFPGYTQTDIGMRSRDVSALLHSLGLADIPTDQRAALIGALTRGIPIPTELAPALRAAQSALGTLATMVEPVQHHSAAIPDLTLRHRYNARRFGLTVPA